MPPTTAACSVPKHPGNDRPSEVASAADAGFAGIGSCVCWCARKNRIEVVMARDSGPDFDSEDGGGYDVYKAGRAGLCPDRGGRPYTRLMPCTGRPAASHA